MPSVDTRVPSEDNHRNPICQPGVLRDRLMLGRTVGQSGLMSSSHDNRADASLGPAVRAADPSSDPAKLAAYLRIVEQLAPDDRTACMGRVVGGRSYDLIADGHSAASPAEARDLVSDAIARVLEEVLGSSPAKSVRLADLLGGDADDADPEEQRLIAELRLLAHDASAHPETWGKFAVVAEIDAGGFGTVYRARDPDLDQDIALKLYHPHRSRGAEKDELLSEARKLARVRHPNVVRVYGAEEHDGRVGVWMELIEGKTLEAEIKSGDPFDADTATDIGMAVCDALSQVHAAGLAHGDIAARNVMRDGDGRVVLTDFGAARFRTPRASESSRGLAGTPAYLAPERFERPEPTVQSDLYSVGVLLFYLVTGEYPVRGRSAKELRKAHGSSASMITLQSLKPDLPDQFARVVERALARSPEHRWLTTAEMGQALRESKPAAERVITIRRVVRVLTVLGASAFIVWLLGFIASRAFEAVLGIAPAFKAGPMDHFVVGAQSLVAVLAHWVIAGLVLVAIGGAHRGLGWMLGTDRKTMGQRLAERVTAVVDPKVAAASVLGLGVAFWLVINWVAFADVFVAVFTLFKYPRSQTLDLSVLGPESSPTHLAHGMYSAYLSFLLGAAAWLWFPHLQRRVTDARLVRFVRIATLVVAFVAVASVTLPRRLVWERFEIVALERQPAFVIASSDREMLLYSPQAAGRTRRVQRDDAEVVSTGITARLFDHRALARASETTP